MHANVTILGRLGHDPEIRYTKQSPPQAVTNFSVAVDRPNKEEDADWWRVTVWGDQAEFAANHLAKGCRVLIEGRPGLDEWTDDNGGHHARLGVTARAVRVIDWAETEAASEDSAAPDEAPPGAGPQPPPPQPQTAARTGRYRPASAGRR